MLCAAWLFLQRPVMAQTKKKITFPPASSLEYNDGLVWVKLKETHKSVFQDDPSGRAQTSNLKAKKISPLVSQAFKAKSSASRIAPLKPHVDISLYYQLAFDNTVPLEQYINDLYATGYFDLIEPVPVISPMLVPNDAMLNQQYYLDLIHANEAWDVTKGNESIVIAIVDTGGDLDHPDLQDNLYIDPAEPVDGIDNDNDGFIDNNRGWDFSGADIALIGTSGFNGDNDPSISKGNLFSHGTFVAGCASASTDNNIGISGVGFNTKLMFIKHFADNQDDAGTNYSSNLYDGILYAATHGAKIINCSWGGYNPSTIAQDIISYVTLDLGCLIIAAAGNSNVETPIYPASYDYVLSVASSDGNDVRSSFSNFGKTIDIIAPGSDIVSTTYNDAYGVDSGTSFAAPLVSGAAALVWALHPSYTPLQVAEQLRASADGNFYVSNPLYINKLGKGRLDVARALTYQSPSIRAGNQKLVDDVGSLPDPGENAWLHFDFTNYLQPSSGNLTATLSSSSPFITITKDQVNIGVVQEMSTIQSAASFEILLSPSLPIDQPVELLLSFKDGAYEDFQLISFVLPSYIDVNENNIITSITSSGRIGFGNTDSQSNGSGFIYNEESLLFEMGLVMGTSSGSLFNNVRGINGTYDQDFTASSRITKTTPGRRSYSEISGGLWNAVSSQSASLDITYETMVWKNDPYQDFVIIEYKVKNTTPDPITDFYFGIFADWDIVSGGAGDRASWDEDTRLGYVFPAQPSLLPQAGVQALEENVHYYAIDNDQSISGNPFGIYDGFTDDEKFLTISSGVSKTQAGAISTGNDVSHVVASGPYSIAPGQEVTIAFALHAANTNEALLNSAKYADSVYNYTLKAPKPSVASVETCYGQPAVINATGATDFNWYENFTGGSPIFSGPAFTTTELFSDTLFYVSNADESYESLRVPANVAVKANPEIVVSGNPEFCEGGTVQLSVADADEYTWSTGEKTRIIEVTTSGQYSVTVRNNSLECAASEPVIVKVNPKPSAFFTLTPEQISIGEEISFMATNGVSWLWDFGDGSTSTDQATSHTYEEVGNYTITLTVTSAEGCEDVNSVMIGIVTGIEEPLAVHIDVFPNPLRNDIQVVNILTGTNDGKLSVYNSQGIRILENIIANEAHHTLNVSHLPNGIYMLKFQREQDIVTKKLVVDR